MILYIVWKTKCNDVARSHILGIYKEINVALKKCNDFRKPHVIKKEDIKISNNGLLNIYCTSNPYDVCYCTQFEVDDDTTEVYFIKILEKDSGSGYFQKCFIYVWMDKNYLIDIANNYFSGEHNRKNECEYCANDKCRKKLIRDLKKNNNASIDCTDFDGAYFEIWCRNLKLK